MDPAQPSVVRSTAQISSITFIARLAGFARWVLLGYAVGTTFLGNVYQTANTIPNIIFELVAGGMLASVLVPTFVRVKDEGTARVSEVASTLANVLLMISIPLVIIGIVFARQLMTASLVGVQDPVLKAKEIELGAWFLRFFLPQIPLYLLQILMQGLLHAHRKFIWPAMGPLLSSLTVITTYVTFRHLNPHASLDNATHSQLLLLAGGTTLGVVALTFCQYPSVHRLGIRWRPALLWRDPLVRQTFRTGGWGAGYLGVTQLILLVAAVLLANRVEGGVVAYQIANAFFELPNALMGLPLALSLYPALSEAFHRGDERRYGDLLSNGWRLLVFGAIPAAVGLFLLAPTAANVLLGWTHDVRPELVSSTLQGLAIGVPPWLLLGMLVRALYARGKTAWPVVMNGLAFAVVVAVGVGGTALLSPHSTSAMRLIGTAVGLGWCASAITGVIVLARLAHGWHITDALRTLLINVARGAAMGAVVWTVLRVVRGHAPGLIVLVAAVASGLVVVVGTALRSGEIRETLAFLGRGVQTQEQ